MSKVLFLANHFVALQLLRKELIIKLCEEGHEVYLSLPANEENIFFEKMGCKIVETDVDRRGVNPIKDFKLLRRYKEIINNIKPDVIFSYTIKPNIYGSMISNHYGFRQVCNITGTGGAFLKENLLSSIAKILYKLSVKNAYKVFFQNTGDRDFFIKQKMIKDNYDMLPGSGCNLQEHNYSPMPQDEVTKFIFIGRVMMLKGIEEYLECAKRIMQKHPNTKFYIAGWIEEEKYRPIIDEYQEKGYVEYLGYCDNIGEKISNCHCTVLPSRGGEGVPNVILETAARGRICIGSNISGTSSAINDGETGYLFEVGNTNSLCEKIELLLQKNYEEKSQMGTLGRDKMEKEFDRNFVIEKYLKEVEQAEGK